MHRGKGGKGDEEQQRRNASSYRTLFNVNTSRCSTDDRFISSAEEIAAYCIRGVAVMREGAERRAREGGVNEMGEGCCVCEEQGVLG